MKRQFVTYAIALKLKELGFNEECFGYYTKEKFLCVFQEEDYFLSNEIPNIYIEAPLWQQAIDWLYTKYNIIIDPVFDDNTWCAHIGKFTIPDVTYDISIQLEEKESFKDSKNAIYELREKAILRSFELI